MDAIGSMKILIEADSAGLTSQLKRAGASITSFVGSMNRQEVNWQKILSSTISPAIIGGIASSFALAITQAVDFQNSMITAANNSSTAFTDNMSQAGQAALGLQATTGQSASEIATGLGIATKALGSYSAGQALVSEASAFSLTTGINLLDLINELIPVMQNWGITDASQIKTTIEGLFGAAEQGKVPLQDLLNTMADTGSVLRTKTTIDNAAASLEAFSNQAGMTSATSRDAFTKIANNTQNVATAADNTVLGMGNWNEQNKILKESGMAGLLATMEQSLSKMGDDTASILLNHAGFSPTDTANIVTADGHYSTLVASTKSISDNMATLGGNIKNNLSDIDKLKVALGLLKTDLTGLGDFALSTLTAAVKGFDDLLHPINTAKDIGSKFSDIFGGNSSNPGGLGIGAGPGVGFISGILESALANAFSNLASMFSGKNGISSLGTQPASNQTQTNNTTNNNTYIQPQVVGNGVGAQTGSSQYRGIFGY